VTVVLPVLGCVPFQPPEAVQLVVLIEVQLKVVVALGATEVLANVNEGAPGGSAANAASAWMKPYPEE
jgi:hypothetical protein